MKVKEAWETYSDFCNEICFHAWEFSKNLFDWYMNLSITHAFISSCIIIFVISGGLFKCLRKLAIWMGDEELISQSGKEE